MRGVLADISQEECLGLYDVPVLSPIMNLGKIIPWAGHLLHQFSAKFSISGELIQLLPLTPSC
jgi:hypothetical protein